MPPRRLRSGAAMAGWPGLLIALLVIVVVLAAWAARSRIPLLANLEGQVIDLQHRLRGPLSPAAEPAISILLVDERSIAELGRLPIDRSVLARAVTRLKRDGARLTAIDMLFTETARHDPAEDLAFASAIREAGNVVLPFALLDGRDANSPPSASLLDNAYRRYRNDTYLALIPLQPATLLQPIAAFAEAALALGNVGVLRDHDGGLRFDLPAVWFEDELYPTLALRIAVAASGVGWDRVEVALGESISFGERRLPLDAVSRQWVNYYGPGATFPTYSFADYLAGRLDAAHFRDRIVLIGGSAVGSSDRYPSPFDPALPGVERVATLTDNLLTSRWLARPVWAAPVEILAILLFPLLAVITIRRMRPLPALAALSLLGAATLGLAQLLFVLQQQFLSLVFPYAALLLSSGFAISLRARFDERSRREAELALRASEERYALAARGANDGLWDWHIVDGEVFFSPRWRELMGIEAEAALSHMDDWIGRLDQLERDRFRRELEQHLRGISQQFHHVFRHLRGGEERWLLARGVAVREGSRALRMAGSITDITEQRRLEERIAFDAIHDRLTGLPNRELFLDRVDQLLSVTQFGPGPEVGVVMVDIDGFLAIEQKHGTLGCNALILEFARRLQTEMGAEYVLAHLGGDQFVLAYRGSPDPSLAGRVQGLFDPAFPIEGEPERVSATLGTAHTTQGLTTAAELLSAASLAMSAGKRLGRGRVHNFDPASQALENSERWLEENIRLALAAGDQFELYYQPFVSLADRRLIGFEALIRWQHPQRGMIMPGDFIPFAEQCGLINPIGRWTLREMARQLVAWDAEGFRGEIAVNLSGRQFAETDLEADAREILSILGRVSPARYKMEVTESMSMANPQRTAEILHRLAGMGFKISIDDFGTGYSSLAYLHRFPFHTLKIDRSFVIRLGSGREAQEIVRTIAGLALALDKQVLAEGVEEEAQAEVLLALGVQVGQGWLFGRPQPVAKARQCFATTAAESADSQSAQVSAMS